MFLVLVNAVFLGFEWTGGKNVTGTNFWVINAKRNILWTGCWRERREYCSPVNIKSIKEKCLYNYCICDIYVPILSICNQWYQSISVIYLSIVIENQYQLITTWIFANDWSSIINIDCHSLISIVIGYPFHRLVPREHSRTSITGTRITRIPR